MRILLTISAALWAAIASASIYVANPGDLGGTPSLLVFAANATGSSTPIRTVSGASTTFNFPEGVTVDTVNNEVYVVDFFGQAIDVFPLNANGNVAPLRSLIQGANSNIAQPRSLALDLVNDQIIVLSGNNGIRTFARTASGDAVPVRTISGANTLLSNPIGIAVDPVHDEIMATTFDAGGGNAGLLVFSRTASGNVAPVRNVSGASTQLGSSFTEALAFDPGHDEVYVAAHNTGYVVFPRTATGNVAPSRFVTGASTGIVELLNMGYDSTSQRLYVSNALTEGGPFNLLAFDRLADGNATPPVTITSAALNDPRQIAFDPFTTFSLATAIPALDRFLLALLAVMLAIYGAARRARK